MDVCLFLGRERINERRAMSGGVANYLQANLLWRIGSQEPKVARTSHESALGVAEQD